MSEKSSRLTSLLTIPVANSLGDARGQLPTQASIQPSLPLPEYARHLYQAVKGGDSARTHNLLRHLSSTHYSITDLHSDVPLICLAACKGHTDIVGLLIRHGSDLEACTPDGSTALICSADNGYLTVLTLLLNAGANMNTVNRNGESALSRATKRGWVQCAKLLLAHGVNPQPIATDTQSPVVSPLQVARQLHQSAIEKDILARNITMETRLLEVIKATLPSHVYLDQPGHLEDVKTSSFFPIQLIADSQLSRFSLHFKTPPNYERRYVHSSSALVGDSIPSDEVILVYVVRVQLVDGQVTNWLTGSGFPGLSMSFNGSRRFCNKLPDVAADHPGLSIFAVSSTLSDGGSNTIGFQSSRAVHSYADDKSQVNNQATNPMVLIGAYRVHVDVVSLIHSSIGLTFGNQT